jgi:hypothetical protein
MTALTGFFSQQLLLFGDCAQRTDTAVVRLARTNNYNATGRSFGPYSTISWAEYAPMVAATTVGLIQPVEDFTNVFARGCDSGNCTFPSSNGASFSTVAMSHICEDISGLIRRHTDLYIYNRTQMALAMFDDSDPSALPSVMTTSTKATTYHGKYGYPLCTITLLFRSHHRANDSRAVNCSLFPTVNTYSVKVEKSVLEETLLSSIPLEYGGPGNIKNAAGVEEAEEPSYEPNLYALATNFTLRNGIMEPCTGSADPAPGLVKHFKVKKNVLGMYGAINRTSTRWYYPEDCLWVMSEPAYRGMRRHFDTMFDEQNLTSTGTALAGGNAYLRAIWQEDPKSYNVSFADIRFTDAMIGQTSFASVDESIKNMTRAMTAFIRTHGAEGEAGYAKGDMWTNTTCVYVRWEWITFPVAMIALTGLFLLLVIIDNWGVESDRLWKSSVLATLFCEVDIQRDRPEGKEGMKEMATSTGVSLEGRSGRLRLVTRAS